jgi:LuxR family maltose regulon positive regulatory protein
MLNRSLVLTAAMSQFSAWLQVHICILQINTAVLIGNVSTARRLARQADCLVRQPNNAVSPVQRAGLLRVVSLLEKLPVDPLFGSKPLTLAEFRILQLLPTHLSFPEIGALLFNSRHTVKTQALAVYRKLGAKSRSDAVQRAQALGFLPPTIVPSRIVPDVLSPEQSSGGAPTRGGPLSEMTC